MSKKSYKSMITISSLVLLGKFLGLYRSILFVNKLGSTWETDSFIIALSGIFIVSNLLGNSLSSGVVLSISSIDDRDKKIKETNNILNHFLIYGLIIILFFYIFSSVFVSILSSGFQGEQLQLTIKLFRIGLPSILFNIVTGILRGYMNTEKSFSEFGLLSVALNIPVIIYLIFFQNKYGIKGLMVAEVIGIAAMLIIQIPFLKKTNYSYNPYIERKSKYMDKIMENIWPIILSIIVVELNYMLDKTIASRLPTGSITSLEFAKNLVDVFVQALFFPVGLILLPVLTKAFDKDELEYFKLTFQKISKIMIIILIPLSLVLFLYRYEFVKLLFGRGKFDSRAINMTSSAMGIYGLGILPVSLNIILQKVLYSMDDTKTPLLVGILNLFLNLILNLTFVGVYKHNGLALGTSLANWISFLIMNLIIYRKLELKYKLKNIYSLINTTILAIIFSVLSKYIYIKLRFLSDSFIKEFLILSLSIGICGLSYFGISYLLNSDIKEVGNEK